MPRVRTMSLVGSARQPAFVLGYAAALLAALASAASGAPVGSRPPPSVTFCSTQFEDRFLGARPGERNSSVYLCPGGRTTLVAVVGAVPATCRERDGGLVGPDLGVSVQFDTLPRTPIRADGSFAFTARSGYDGRVLGIAKAVVRVRGVFDGRTVKGRVKITSGAWWRYTHCTADARFHATL